MCIVVCDERFVLEYVNNSRFVKYDDGVLLGRSRLSRWVRISRIRAISNQESRWGRYLTLDLPSRGSQLDPADK